jgi:hypothetical protein
MSEADNVERVLHFRFRAAGVDISQLLTLIKSAVPFWQVSGTRMRLLRNVDDPSTFIQELEYTVPEMFEANRQAIAGDPTIQTYLRAWRQIVPGGVEVDVFEDVTE